MVNAVDGLTNVMKDGPMHAYNQLQATWEDPTSQKNCTAYDLISSKSQKLKLA